MSPSALKSQLASRKVAFSFAFISKQFPVTLLGFKAGSVEVSCSFPPPPVFHRNLLLFFCLLLKNKSLSPAPLELQFAVLSLYETFSYWRTGSDLLKTLPHTLLSGLQGSPAFQQARVDTSLLQCWWMLSPCYLVLVNELLGSVPDCSC